MRRGFDVSPHENLSFLYNFTTFFSPIIYLLHILKKDFIFVAGKSGKD